MLQEIERKFLVKGDFSPYVFKSYRITQGYLSIDPSRTVRIRLRDGEGFLTVKGEGDEQGISRFEWEIPIPDGDAEQLLKLCLPGVIDKTRNLVRCGEHIFEVDVFHGANEGLVLTEVELKAEDECFEFPAWLGEEVSGNPRYYNSYLSEHPYSTWR